MMHVMIFAPGFVVGGTVVTKRAQAQLAAR